MLNKDQKTEWLFLQMEKERLLREYSILFCDYEDFKERLLNAKSYNEANTKLYDEELKDLDYLEEESRFDLCYESLNTRIKNNKKDRNHIANELKIIKQKIKHFNKNV